MTAPGILREELEAEEVQDADELGDLRQRPVLARVHIALLCARTPCEIAHSHGALLCYLSFPTKGAMQAGQRLHPMVGE